MGLAESLIAGWGPILASVELVSSRGGVFLVSCDDEPVFDKKAEGRHALPKEIEARLEPVLGPRLEWR